MLIDSAQGTNPALICCDSRWKVWGKLRRDARGEVIATHPLNDHLIDVAACFVAMLETAGVRRAASHAAGRPLTQQDIQRLAVLVMLHDVGKCCAGFQTKFWARDSARDHGWPMASGHGSEGWVLLANPESIPRAHELWQALSLEEIGRWGEAAYSLLHASISHHGRPVAEPNNASRRL